MTSLSVAGRAQRAYPIAGMPPTGMLLPQTYPAFRLKTHPALRAKDFSPQPYI
ncbi:MAG: hypothetical protein WBA10_08755 [Elainellaceae cyanobacterium]